MRYRARAVINLMLIHQHNHIQLWQVINNDCNVYGGLFGEVETCRLTEVMG